MHLTAIAAIDQRGGIGLRGGLPWPRLPRDLARFRELTMGKPVLMGRTTYAGLGRATLPGRHLIVLSRDLAFVSDAVWVARSVEQALKLASRFDDEVIVAGGEQVYAALLPRCDRLRLTVVGSCFEADTWWPWRLPGNPLGASSAQWVLGIEASHTVDEQHPHALTFWDCWRKETV